ncbi:bifunctional diaminohydroxyphosphoribosylaminopyrimidine deaminase/5-amino-6-(5-phosphoribosylamino)uracil reductase RibD [Isoptericola variabilis]|uniref:Riboflavin biosynthesis protein RibD n=1 Tax=Isoptericola variabilis (strain 225) TaxID=743718 RepID=F6FUD9_ISOV2|nr:bifunctional diaminohydroxyphosphoribosylaminopyrimidine deaminase/5-amino-6-(5-phosphoribosylamino)uracil reductase RibD [Isoptericola variabilis]AEG44267.1 riboflavin biosynthesis protein RibD [Isoptericola variabilis 225]TWH28413.1 diaminohydroxyphosphoribosylaminopyrimidine deaminase [Isoptericola variabilis J7]
MTAATTTGPTTSEAERAAMRRALALAATPGRLPGPNPRVGCVLLAPDGGVVAEGFHRGAGTPHAEADALLRARAAAGPDAARGATAVVTLEPCAHRGRTGPCAEALVEAGVARVVFAQPDPNPVAAGGAAVLRDAGIDVVGGLLADEARALNATWTRAMELGRPVVTWKVAASLDGRTAAADGSSRWISSAAARRDAHALRSAVDTVLVGTGTLLADDPALTVRDAATAGAAVSQPLRAVMGRTDVPASARVRGDGAPAGDPGWVHLRTRDPRVALAELWALERRHVLLEGGPRLAAAFWRAGLVDELVVYVAPVLLGAGPAAVADLGITTISDAARLEVTDVTVLEAPGEDTNVRLTLRPRKEG